MNKNDFYLEEMNTQGKINRFKKKKLLFYDENQASNAYFKFRIIFKKNYLRFSFDFLG